MKSSINTERLTLDKLNNGDAPFIFNLLNTKEWIDNIGLRNITSVDDAKTYIGKINANENYHFWVVKLNETPIGIITFLYKDYLPAPDIGFAFLKEYTGKGYAYEAAKGVMEVAVNEYGIRSICGVTLKSNIASQKVLGKLKLTYKHDIIIDNEELMLYAWEEFTE